MTITFKIAFTKKIKSSTTSRIAWYSFVQILRSCCLLSKNINLVFNINGRTQAEGVRKQNATEEIQTAEGGSNTTGENCIMIAFVVSAPRQKLLGLSDQRR